MSITDDVQRRSAHIHWPGDVNPDRADLFAHNDIVVNAPSGILGPGVTFDWVTFGASIQSTVHEIEPGSRIGWYGTTSQWRAYHTWLLMPRPDGSTYVVMEETGDGASRVCGSLMSPCTASSPRPLAFLLSRTGPIPLKRTMR